MNKYKVPPQTQSRQSDRCKLTAAIIGAVATLFLVGCGGGSSSSGGTTPNTNTSGGTTPNTNTTATASVTVTFGDSPTSYTTTAPNETLGAVFLRPRP